MGWYKETKELKGKINALISDLNEYMPIDDRSDSDESED